MKLYLCKETPDLVLCLALGLRNKDCNEDCSSGGDGCKDEVAGGGVDGVPEGWHHQGYTEGHQPVEGSADRGGNALN